MQRLDKLEAEAKALSREEKESLREFLENLLEDEREVTPEFQEKIERGEQDLREGRVRIRKP